MDTTEAILFPSTAWFERLAALMHERESEFREFGAIDCAMVVKVDIGGEPSRLFEIVFEGFGVKSIRELRDLAEAAPSHFVVEGPLAAWREMIENIHAHGGPDLAHTLNYLTLPDVPLRVVGPDQLEVDAFYRYNESLQRFFNGAAQFDTEFIAPAAAAGVGA